MKFFKRFKIILFSVAAAVAAAVLGLVLAAEYSAEDPLISLSYLEQIFYPKVTSYVDQSVADSSASASESQEDENNAKAGYEVITLTQGQTLIANGSLELILRPGGAATVKSDIPENGIADLTNAKELLNGEEIPINAYCLIPRADGRGIVCVSETAYVMVRGEYEIR